MARRAARGASGSHAPHLANDGLQQPIDHFPACQHVHFGPRLAVDPGQLGNRSADIERRDRLGERVLAAFVAGTDDKARTYAAAGPDRKVAMLPVVAGGAGEIFGVRPNSPIITTSVLSISPRSQRSSSKAAKRGRASGKAGLAAARNYKCACPSQIRRDLNSTQRSVSRQSSKATGSAYPRAACVPADPHFATVRPNGPVIASSAASVSPPIVCRPAHDSIKS